MRHKSSYEGRGIKDAIAKLLSGINLVATHETHPNELYPGETHAIFKKDGKNVVSLFTGPGTKINLREHDVPVNKTDAISKKHDIAYDKINKQLKSGEIKSEKEALELIHDADEDFIESLKKIKDLDLTSQIAIKAIMLKKYLENKNILDKKVFSFSGSGYENTEYDKYFKPEHMLRKEYNQKIKNKDKKGGLLPLTSILPILIPIITSLGEKAIGSLYNKFVKKEGSGIDIEKKKKLILHYFDNKPSNFQIEKMYDFIKKMNDKE